MRLFHYTLRVLLGSIALSAMPVSAQSFSPLTPTIHANYQPDPTSTEGGLWMTMDRFEEATRHSPMRIQEPAINAYLNELVCALSPDHCGAIRVYVVRIPHFNAFMAPNGMMVVYTGLLLRMRNRSQLAAVLGHEFGHYLRRHSLARFEDAKLISNLSMFLGLGLSGAVAAGGINANAGQAINDISQFALIASFFSFNRSQEYEADQYGAQLLANANLSTREAAAVWKNLIAEQDSAVHAKNKGSSFFASHPPPDKRFDKLDQYSKILEPEPNILEHDPLDNYQDALSPHMDMLLSDELDLQQFGQTEHLFRALIADNVAPGLLHFYLGELYRIRNHEGDRELAKQYYTDAIELADHLADVHRSLGLLYLKDKQYAEANAHFTVYLERKPDASDQAMIHYYMTTGASQ